MDGLEGIMLSDISQTEKDNIVWSHWYVGSENEKTLKKKPPKLLGGFQKGCGVWMKWMKVVKRYKLPVVR